MFVLPACPVVTVENVGVQGVLVHVSFATNLAVDGLFFFVLWSRGSGHPGWNNSYKW